MFAASKIRSALKRKDYARLKELLQKGVSPDVTSDSYNKAPLTFAVEEGDVEAAEILLDAGARRRRMYWSDRNHFFSAIIEKNYDMARLLYEKDPRYASADLGNDGRPALHSFAYMGNLEAVKFILSLGFDINTLCRDNRTAYYWAKKGSRDEVVEFLEPYFAKKPKALPAPADSGWRQIDDDSIVHISTDPVSGLYIRDKFNFAVSERTIVCRDLETKQQSQETKPFDQCSPDSIDAAAARLQAAGGLREGYTPRAVKKIRRPGDQAASSA